jgi:hypothetical protein
MPLDRFKFPLDSLRSMPSFVIVGAQKCGTSSLYSYLLEHPSIYPAYKKEVHFFDVHFSRGIKWYRAQFPLLLQARSFNRSLHRVTGEATPYYLFHPHAPRRLGEVLPQGRIIVLLRDPVARAYSHYHHNRRPNLTPAFFEPLSFEEALACEDERIQPEIEKMLANEFYRSHKHQAYSYKTRGIYVNQIDELLKHYPREQVIVLKSEDLFSNPQEVCERVFQFLGLPAYAVKNTEALNKGRYEKGRSESSIRKQLREFFAPYNQRLYERIGVDFDW